MNHTFYSDIWNFYCGKFIQKKMCMNKIIYLKKKTTKKPHHRNQLKNIFQPVFLLFPPISPNSQMHTRSIYSLQLGTIKRSFRLIAIIRLTAAAAQRKTLEDAAPLAHLQTPALFSVLTCPGRLQRGLVNVKATGIGSRSSTYSN